MLRGMDLWTFGGADASVASTRFGLRRARLKIVVLQPTVVSRFGCFLVFEFWVLRFRDLGAPFSSYGCFVFEFWVLRFRDLGASCLGLRFRALRFRNNRAYSLLAYKSLYSLLMKITCHNLFRRK